MSISRRTVVRKPLSLVASGALVAGVAATVTTLGAGAAQAADLNRDFTFTCNVVAAGLPLGDHAVGVNAKVSVPDQVAPGEVIPTRKTQITLTLPETLRNATYGLLGARQASGYSNDSSITVTAEGVPDVFTYPIANLAADWTPVPADASTPWKIPTEGDVPPITVPSTEDYPDLELPTDAVIHMPKAFNVVASLRNAAGELIGGEGAVSMKCALSGTDDLFGVIPIVAPDPVNTPPTAGDVSAETAYGTPVDVTLEGADADGDALTYTYGTPANGSVSGSGADVTYTPADGFSGSDSFTYTVSDGEAEATGTVSVTVGEKPNAAPVALDGSATTDEDTPVDITLAASDADGDDLSYAYTQPENGEVTGDGPAVTYTPEDGFVGNDAFTFTVNDGKGGTDTATVAITVRDVAEPNTPPTAEAVSASTDEGKAVEVTLKGADADGDALTYTYTQPANGTVSGSGATVTYTPDDGFFGEDAFSYTVSDGTDTATAAVTVTVKEVEEPPTNTPPTAGDVSATTDEGKAVEVTLKGADADGDALTYSYTEPANGTVSGSGATVTYTPDDGFFGTDSFDYTVSDGEAEATGTVTVTVKEVEEPPTNTPPTAGDVSATTDQGKAVAIALKGADADGDPLAYSYTQPAGGAVSGSGATVTYTPKAGFSGTDTFTYTVDDGKGGTATGKVTVTVKKASEPPVDKCGPQPNPLREPFKWLKWLACKLLQHFPR
ncbi:Ig-like domain-containing protein [Mumia sp. ZJ430]|uniref:Ig-like domain-containing protein n=1 Tax=Mumia sp. ZJ430 TaxID=2708083 RepID=UPI00142386C9|nr:Ig-like domain-containing protein [Mumia sp. ZJ430]